MTQDELAEILQVSRTTVSRWETGERDPLPRQRRPLAKALEVTYPVLEYLLATSPTGAENGPELVDTSNVESAPEIEGTPVDRRDFMTLASTSVAGMVLSTARAVRDLAVVLVEPQPAIDPAADLSLPSLTAGLAEMKTAYQACHYDLVARGLPDLLGRLKASAQYAVGDDRLAVAALTAQAHHVTASVLLKLDNDSLATLAAERSMDAARRSEDPVMVAASARIVTHSLMSAGQNSAAAGYATTRAEELSPNLTGSDPAALSVYGSLLLRGAVAASLDEDSERARSMLDEAEGAAVRLGKPANHHWTAFGYDNVMAHRVAVEISLGNYGTAIDHVGRIRLANLGVAERQATVCIDAARAYAHWGKFEEAVTALHGAEQVSAQELRVRPTAHNLVHQIRRTGPASARHDLDALVERVGMAA